MHRILTLLFLVLTINLWGQGIEFFQGTWDEALTKAKEEGKIIFVDAYASWCGPCKRMSANVFPQEKVGDFYNKHFINIKYDMEKPESTEFRKYHQANAYPTLLFIDFDNSLVHKKVGALDVAGFLRLGETALKMVDRTDQYAPIYESGDRSPELVLNYIKALNQAGKPSLKIANDYVNTKPDFSKEQNLLILYEATVQADSRIFNMMTKYKPQITNIVGAPAVNEKIKEACKATVQTAVEFKSEDLLNEAQEKCKKFIPIEFSWFEKESNRLFALKTKNSKQYIKSAKSMVDDKSLDEMERQKLMKDIVVEVLDVFDKDVKVLKLAEDYSKDLVKMDDIYAHRYMLAEVQYVSGKYLDAKSNAMAALAKANAKKVNPRKIQILLKKIEEHS
ncbi:MAG: thioredoxin family protein [Bacteroidia bacterium]|nr:thioredoxin family protein [Bacteroidia bacterium]